MRKIILLLILLTCFRYGYSQSLSSYSFNAFSCPYDSLTTSFIAKSGNTPGGGGPYDDCYYNSIPIGFNFDYCGTTYTSLSASSNCWITLGQTLPFSSSLIVNTYDCDLSGTSTSGLAFPYNLPRPILAALWMDVVTTGPNVRYTTKGTAPNRVFVIEWTNCGFYSFTGVYPPHINVEILLYETTNNIDFTYSTISPGSSNTGLEAIGITGGAGAYPVTGTQPYWSLSDAGPSPTASMTVETRSIPTLPATDQVYRWSYQCAGKPEAGNISPSISSSCSSFSSTLSLECTSSKGAGITYQWQSSPDSVTWTNISGAKADTYAVTITVNTYFRCILTCTNSNLRDTTNGAKLQLNPPPAAITGTAIVCASKTTTLTDATSGGFWSSSNTTIATVSGGVVTGSTAGTSTITYKLLSGCFATRTVTVNPMPGAITGIKTVCTGYTTLLSDALTGGTWSTANTSIATVNSSTGLVTGISAGTALITYSKGTGAICEVFTTVTVNATPLPITGANSVCVGLTTSLSSVTGGGTWTSSNTSVATINPSTGLVTGIMAGTSIISYTLSTGCAASIIVTVNPLPSNIVGSNNVCIGQTVTLASLGGGTWTSGNTTIATIGISSGVVTGISTGSTTITYTLATGCITTVVMNVHANPAAITGTTILCTGGTTTLSDATPVGLWSSSNTTVASIGSLTGFVTGLSAGTTTITYLSTAGCKATTTVTINPLPPSISGGPGVCLDNSITLNDAITGGTWTSSNTSIADIDLSTGVMTGMSTGTATITYTLAIPGCVITTTVTVNPPPAPITGPTAVCAGASIAITDATPGGTWSSSNTTVAIVIPGGTVFGSTNGTTTITYKAPGTGCITTTTITVSSAPVAISGVTKTCIGSTTTLSDLVSGGTWTSGNTSIATAGYTTGVITGMAAGTVTISYSLGGSCIVTIVVTVNTLPPAITGTTNVCPGATTTLTGGGGGIWSSSNTTIATVNTSTGLVTGIVTGTATITYTVLSTGCSITRTVTVSPVPAAISGAMTICIGNSWTLSNTTTGGTWTSSNTGIATISLSSGLLSGIATGTASITYTAPVTGCSITGTVTVTPPPPAITGITNVCQGSTTTLSDAASGGTWSSSITTIATIGTSSGVVTGIAAGTTTITYTPPSGCAITTVVTVDPLPSAISGPSVVCAGGTMTLTNSGGGTWSSGNTAVATIGVSSGLVTGVAFGTTTITYTLPTGCETTITITVSPAPVSISGSTSLCIGTTTNLTDAIVGGTWTSGSTAIATVGSASGIVTGVAPGTANIIYSLGTGCTIGTTVTVGASPAPITGITNICIGTAMSTLSDATTGGTWTSSNTAVATIGLSSGNISGITAGTATITYTNGCTTITTVTVNQTPTAITGPGNVCQGSAITLSDAVTGGTWTSGNTSVATTPLGSGNISGLAAGTATITYTLGSGCAVTKVITVNPVAPITGSTSLCTGIPETLSDAITGGTWTSSNTLAATVGLTTGTVTGHIAGSTVTINYRSPYGCLSSIIISVNSAPAAITGITKVCAGQTTTLSDGTAGGSWTSSNTTIATAGSSSGVISGIAAGTATITYSLGFGCTVTTIVTVNPASAVITGATGVCAGSSITISNSSPGGTWSSSNTAVATIGVTSGTISGLSAGTTIITYALTGGCSSTRTITVNPLPGPISGGGKLCVGQMLTLYESMTGGTWSGSSTAVATIGSSSGDVTGVSPGIFTAVYTINGCTASTTVTVIPSPLPITGPSSVCVGSTTTLSNGTPGGIWTTSGKSIAVIDAVTGAVTPFASGTILVSYTLASGCNAITALIINPMSPITGSHVVCAGSSTTLADTTLGGTWSSSNTLAATVGVSTGKVTGSSAGVTSIIYTTPKGCTANYTVTVVPLPPNITGTKFTCVGQTTTLSNPTTGGTWNSSNTVIATVNPTTGLVSGMSAGAVLISYTLSGCPAVATVTINPLPAPIAGPSTVCMTTTITLTSSAGGTWSSSGRISVGSTSGIVTGISPGTATVVYTLPTGCSVSKILTVNSLPAPITGIASVCEGMSTSLSSFPSGGTWSSGVTTIATVGIFSGIANGVSAGNSVIAYTLPTGCAATVSLTVNPLPAAISGNTNVCIGSTTTLSDTGTGIWSSSNSAIASAGVTTGIISGIALGTATITYTLSTGCFISTSVTVNPVPLAVTGQNRLCIGHMAILSDATTGGSWSSDNTAIATIDAFGNIAGITPGIATISYTLPTGCAAVVAATVTPLPKPISGTTTICFGSSALFSDSVPGGTWSSSVTTVATIGSISGSATGLSLGTTSIIYSMAPGCDVSLPINVVPLPTSYSITGGGTICSTGPGVHVGLTGSTVGVNYFLYIGGVIATGPVAGTGIILDFGLQTVGGTYTVVATNALTGCSSSMSGSVITTVIPSVTPTVNIIAAPGDTICSGQLDKYTAVTTNEGTSPTYRWDVNGTITSLTKSYSFIPADGDVVTFTLTSSALCATPAIVSSSVKMKVLDPVIPSATIDAAPGDTICEGSPVTLTALPVFGGKSPTYQWFVNTASVGSGPTFTYVPANKDVVYCNMMSNYICLVKATVPSSSIVMTVDTPIIPHVSVIANPGTNIGIGISDTLTAIAENAGPSPTYQWYMNGYPIPGATTNTYISNQFDTLVQDSVTCVVTSSGPCNITTFGWVYIYCHNLGVNTIGNGDGITIVPNPNKGTFTIKGRIATRSDEVSLVITDLLGQVVYNSRVQPKNGNLNEQVKLANTLANGMYLLSIHGDKVNEVFHIVVEQ